MPTRFRTIAAELASIDIASDDDEVADALHELRGWFATAAERRTGLALIYA